MIDALIYHITAAIVVLPLNEWNALKLKILEGIGRTASKIVSKPESAGAGV